MISKKDAQIISHLRNNSRKKITLISLQTSIPVTTIYDKVRNHERKYVKKNTCLLNFHQLGMMATAFISVKVNKEGRKELQDFLKDKSNVNSLFITNFGSEFLFQCIFKNNADVHNFADEIETKFPIIDIKIFNIIEEIKCEDFLTKPEHFDMLN
ncbi:MAG: Lrp/AsnC family transcriptional regulator [Candidatus Woesearchaeota archaeon]